MPLRFWRCSPSCGPRCPCCFRPTPATLQRGRTTTIEAIAMHETVSPARWCVTYQDLQFFQQEVRAAIKEGQIFACDFSSSISECGRDAEIYGPSIYLVNENYIKPITAAAGKMSWALMMNPEGLDSDLFITHAWQEGIFEFLEKVLTSWPGGARHAWCCMLANPQNLDISALLHSPSLSPFAVALQSSEYMLVVPNRYCSVYTRLWCGYEAYLAAEGHKTIRTARRSIKRQVITAYLWMCPTCLLGIALGLLFERIDFNFDHDLVILAFVANVLGKHFGETLCLLANHLGLASSTALVMGTSPQITNFLEGIPCPISHEIATWVQRLLCLSLVFFFLIAESDRVFWHQLHVEGSELRKQYPGSIRGASCSERRDEENIRSEIGDKVDEVDVVIHVLINAGLMSEPLRNAYLKGVNIENTGDAEWAIPMMFLGPQLMLGFWQFGRYASNVSLWEPYDGGWLLVVFQGISIVARLCFLVLLWRSCIDERCFMLKVMTRLVSLILCTSLIALAAGARTPLLVMVMFVTYHGTFPLVLFFAALGIQGTLNLPGGRWLLSLFVARHRWRRSASTGAETAASSSDASSSEAGTS